MTKVGTAVWVSVALLAAAYVHSAGAAVPGWSGEKSAPHLSLIVRSLTRPGARVYCGHGPVGNAGEAVKASDEIVLAPDVCAALRAAPRVIEPPYPRTDSGEAVFVLAHEAGHLVRGTGADAESQADCYAASHWRSYARALGYRDLSALRQQQGGEGCWH